MAIGTLVWSVLVYGDFLIADAFCLGVTFAAGHMRMTTG